MLGIKKNLIEHEVLGGWSLNNTSVGQNQNLAPLPKRAVIITPMMSDVFSVPDPVRRSGCLILCVVCHKPCALLAKKGTFLREGNFKAQEASGPRHASGNWQR